MRSSALVFIAAAVCACAQTPSFQAGVRIGTNEAAALTECSGLAASRKNPHVLWAHNDSGAAPRLFALNRAGRLLATFDIVGAANTDWEDIALGGDPDGGTPFIFIGDIGDNTASRSTLTIYKIAEPDVATNVFDAADSLSIAATYTVSYPDGARDAESLMHDPWTGDLFILTKSENSNRVYCCPYPPSTTATNVLELVALLSYSNTVAADISPSGRQILVKRYSRIAWYPRHPTQTVAQAFSNPSNALPYTLELQGEAICWSGREEGYYTLSEFAGQPLWFYASADTDADDLPDAVEYALGAQLNQADSDGDGMEDGDEFIAGTDATNAASVFAAASVQPTSGQVRVEWLARTSRLYTVERALATNAADFQPAATDITVATDGPASTNLPATEDAAFFRVTVRDAAGW